MERHRRRHSAIERSADRHPPPVFVAIAGEECGFGIFPRSLRCAQAMLGKMAQGGLEQPFAAQPAAPIARKIVVGGIERHANGAEAAKRGELVGAGSGKMNWHQVSGSGSIDDEGALPGKPLTLSVGLWFPNS